MIGDARETGKELLSRWGGSAHRQKALADLALFEFEGPEFVALCDAAAERVCEVLGVDFCSVYEWLPHDDALLLRSGVGWREGDVGERTVAVGLRSPASTVTQAVFTLLVAEEPVCVEDLDAEPRFGGCPLLRNHGILSGITVRIETKTNRRYGVLGAHSTRTRRFTEEEAHWLKDVAGLLGAALGRREDANNDLRDAAASGARARAAEERLDALMGAMACIAAPGGKEEALEAAARVAVGSLADWCFVDLLEDDSGSDLCPGATIRRRLVASDLLEPDQRALAEQLPCHYPLDLSAPHGTPKVFRTKEPDLIAEIDDAVLRTSAEDERHLEILRRLAPKSYLSVPLWLGPRVVGALALVSTDAARRFGEDDVRRARDLAGCLGLVLAGGRGTSKAARELVASQELASLARQQPDVVSHDRAPVDPGPLLTARQRQVLELLAEGCSDAEIARKLVLSRRTVETHVRRTIAVFGARSRAQAVAFARSRGVL